VPEVNGGTYGNQNKGKLKKISFEVNNQWVPARKEQKT